MSGREEDIKEITWWFGNDHNNGVKAERESVKNPQSVSKHLKLQEDDADRGILFGLVCSSSSQPRLST